MPPQPSDPPQAPASLQLGAQQSPRTQVSPSAQVPTWQIPPQPSEPPHAVHFGAQPASTPASRPASGPASKPASAHDRGSSQTPASIQWQPLQASGSVPQAD